MKARSQSFSILTKRSRQRMHSAQALLPDYNNCSQHGSLYSEADDSRTGSTHPIVGD